MKTYIGQKGYTFLKDVAITSDNLDRHHKESSKVLRLLSKLPSLSDEERKSMSFMVSEIIRDANILKRKLSFIFDKICNGNLEEEISQELNDNFIDLLNNAKVYNDKWKQYYEDIDSKLAKMLC